MASLKPVLLRKGLAALTALPIVWLMTRLPYVGWGLLVYSVISLSTESFFTGFGDQIRRLLRRVGIDWNLPCRTWLWAIVVYGVSAGVGYPLLDFLKPGFSLTDVFPWPAWLPMGFLSHTYFWQWPTSLPAFFDWPLWVRGPFYAIGIFLWEFYWGWYIETLFGLVPWQYQVSTYRIWRYIRPRYAGFWVLFGLVLEWTHLHIIHRLDQILPIVLGP